VASSARSTRSPRIISRSTSTSSRGASTIGTTPRFSRPTWQDAEEPAMSPKNKRRTSHAERIKKYAPEERREREKRHGPVERERFEEVIKRLIETPAPARSGRLRGRP